MITNNMDFVDIFEQKLCDYTGFKYAVCVDCCTNALLLCCELLNNLKIINKQHDILHIPCQTYLSVPMTLMNYGWKIIFKDIKWSGKYEIINNIYDAATDFKENMCKDYNDTALVCVSFQQKKRLNLDQGGVIFTNNYEYVDILKRMRHDGRNPKLSHIDEVTNTPDLIIRGYHMYFSPEKAAKGILILNQIQQLLPYTEFTYKNYPNISNLQCFNDNKY